LVGLEVWLTEDAPALVLDRLRTAGVEVVSERTVAAATARLRSQGPGIALRVQLFAAAMALLVAAGTITVSAAVERGPRASELSALRTQGLSRRAVLVTAYLGATVLSGGAILTGLLARPTRRSGRHHEAAAFTRRLDAAARTRSGPYRPLVVVLVRRHAGVGRGDVVARPGPPDRSTRAAGTDHDLAAGIDAAGAVGAGADRVSARGGSHGGLGRRPGPRSARWMPP